MIYFLWRINVLVEFMHDVYLFQSPQCIIVTYNFTNSLQGNGCTAYIL